MSDRRLSLLLLLTACAAPPPDSQGDAWEDAVLQRLAATDRAFLPDGADGFRASLPAVGLDARLDADGVALDTVDARGLTVRLQAWGREASMVSAAAVPPVLGACSDELDPTGACLPRVEFEHEGLVEWWASRADGMEQGFELEEAPAGRGLVWVDLALDGVEALEVEGETAWLLDHAGQEWSVSGLAAWDADGAPLDIGMEATDDGLSLWVDTAGARYPVTIDPVYTTASSTLTGPSTNSYFGYSVDGAGDVNGDGYDDIIVGAYNLSSATGYAYIYHGSSAGMSTTASTAMSGPSTNSYFGRLVAGGGDINGDGYDDVIVGADGYSSNTGRVYIYQGGSAGVDSTADATLSGSATSGYFGRSASSAGDVNRDGYDDVVVGAYGISSNSGRVFVYHGAAAGLDTSPKTMLGGPGTNTYFGRLVANAGDVNGDGYDDILVGAYGASTNYGAAYLYLGSASGVSTSVSSMLTGPASGSYFGFDGDGVGDVNADGYDDVIVGAYAVTSYTGKAYVYHGGASGIDTTADSTLSGPSTSSYFGYSARAAGDADGDGYNDVVVGAYAVSSNSGKVYVYPGSATGVSTTADSTLSGPSTNSYFGLAVAGAGDINGDGEDDVVVGAYGVSSYTGAGYVYLGYAVDTDGDGSTAADDCDDNDPSAYPGATEVCDGVDNDCDSSTPDCASPDADGDGYGDATIVVEVAGAPSGYVTNQGDCDDTDAAINPTASEITGDEIDQNCDDVETCYADADADGAVGTTTTSSADTDCVDSGEGTTAEMGEDCDDGDATKYPGAPETVADGIDQDCDDYDACYADADGDGYRSDDTVVSTDLDCTDAGEADSSYPSGDCDDADSSISPAATDIPASGADEDCDGSESCYWDRDFDGWAGTNTVVSADGDCSDRGEGDSSEYGSDCDDTDSTVSPGADEVPADGIDQDCDDGDDCYEDADHDGYAAEDGSVTHSSDMDCTDSGELDASAPGGDCDDGESTTYPGATELDDGLDNDCDGYNEIVDSDGDGVTNDIEDALGTDAADTDTDDDGLDDGAEVNDYSSDPLDSDSDDDGLEDGDEVNSYDTNPASADSDADGTSDYDEVVTLGTDPNDTDTDDDGLVDGDERPLGLDPLDSDSDDDGLIDGDEITAGTDGADPDSDDDGLLDGTEVQTSLSDPLDSDSDDDGVADGVEVNTLGSDPNDTDSDDDGLTDYREFELGTDPTTSDTDGDGFTDPQEIDDGTDPLDAGDPAPAEKSCGCASGGSNAQVLGLGLALALVTARARRRPIV